MSPSSVKDCRKSRAAARTDPRTHAKPLYPILLEPLQPKTVCWAELWLVNIFFIQFWAKSSRWQKCWHFSILGNFWEFQNCKQIIGTHHRSMFHAPKSSQMPYTAKIRKINNFTNKIKNPLERRLGFQCKNTNVRYLILLGGTASPSQSSWEASAQTRRVYPRLDLINIVELLQNIN